MFTRPDYINFSRELLQLPGFSVYSVNISPKKDGQKHRYIEGFEYWWHYDITCLRNVSSRNDFYTRESLTFNRSNIFLIVSISIAPKYDQKNIPVTVTNAQISGTMLLSLVMLTSTLCPVIVVCFNYDHSFRKKWFKKIMDGRMGMHYLFKLKY